MTYEERLDQLQGGFKNKKCRYELGFVKNAKQRYMYGCILHPYGVHCSGAKAGQPVMWALNWEWWGGSGWPTINWGSGELWRQAKYAGWCEQEKCHSQQNRAEGDPPQGYPHKEVSVYRTPPPPPTPSMWRDASLKCLYTNTRGMGRTQEEFHAWKDPMQYGPREKRSRGELNDFQESPPPSSKMIPLSVE